MLTRSVNSCPFLNPWQDSGISYKRRYRLKHRPKTRLSYESGLTPAQHFTHTSSVNIHPFLTFLSLQGFIEENYSLLIESSFIAFDAEVIIS